MTDAAVIGAGTNGLAAAISLARAGLRVEVFEAQGSAGGACRSMELTLPGFRHDFGSAVFPMAAGSPFFRDLALAKHGLEWVHGDAPLAHPLDDGSAVVLEHPLDGACPALGVDGARWRSLVGEIAARWDDFAEDGLRPPLHWPKHPLLMAKFGANALQPAEWMARSFRTPRARALFAGLAAHSFLPFDAPMSSAIGIVLGAAAHAQGWPVPRGGAQAIPDALSAHLHDLGGVLRLHAPVADVRELHAALTLCDVTPKQLLALAGTRLSDGYRAQLRHFASGPGVFKVDYALSAPIPWRAKECARAITVHIGGSFEEIARAETDVSEGRVPEKPFVILAQPTLFDPTRAPQGKHIAWAYCHVPYGCDVDMTAAVEAQIERFAPGFGDCILARHTMSPAELAAADANLHGGDISAGAMTLRQFFARPTPAGYRTSNPKLYLCSASTPPGGGVHGMCGANAAAAALRAIR